MDTEERKKWLKWTEIGICVPLNNKDANEKQRHFRETSKLPGGRVQRTHGKRKKHKDKTNLLTR